MNDNYDIVFCSYVISSLYFLPEACLFQVSKKQRKLVLITFAYYFEAILTSAVYHHRILTFGISHIKYVTKLIKLELVKEKFRFIFFLQFKVYIGTI